MRTLADYSTEKLLAELKRRIDEAPPVRPITRWCHECVHWRYSKSDNDKANNCTRKHVMEFKAPEDYPDGEAWGFYRRGCTDWCATPPKTPAPHNPFPPDPPRPPPGSTPRRVK
jgi:hypothetical protein